MSDNSKDRNEKEKSGYIQALHLASHCRSPIATDPYPHTRPMPLHLGEGKGGEICRHESSRSASVPMVAGSALRITAPSIGAIHMRVSQQALGSSPALCRCAATWPARRTPASAVFLQLVFVSAPIIAAPAPGCVPQGATPRIQHYPHFYLNPIFQSSDSFSK